MDYNFREIEKKWQKAWVDNKTYKVTEDPTRPKYYVLNMFPYPPAQVFMWAIPLAISPRISTHAISG